MKALAAAAGALLFAAAAAAQSGCPKPDPSRPDFSGQDLTDRNFAGQNLDLRGANFTKAVLNGAQFPGVDLTGAIFQEASLAPSAKGKPDFTGAVLVKACFEGATLQRPNLQFAKLACADFSRTDLTQVDFGPQPLFDPAGMGCGDRVKFVDATIGVRQIAFSLWKLTDFTRTRFIGIDPRTFRDADIGGAMLPEGKFADFQFNHSTLTGVDLRGADLQRADFSGAKARGIKLDGADFRGATARGAETDFSNASLRRLMGGKADFSGALLVSAVLRGANLAGATLTETNLKGAILEQGDGLGPVELSGAIFDGATLDDAHLNFVSFRRTRMIGASFTHVKLTDTDFSDAVMPSVNFFGATLEGVTFRGSSLELASFREAELLRSTVGGRPVSLACTQLGGADLSNLKTAPLEDAVSFLGAVLPDADSCRNLGNSRFFCGNEPASGRPYGPTLLPVLTHRATCPNNDFVVCSGKTWLLKDWTTTFCGVPEKRWTPPPK